MLVAAVTAAVICAMPLIMKMAGADETDIAELKLLFALIVLLLMGWPLLTAMVMRLFLRRSVLATVLATLVSILVLAIAIVLGSWVLVNHYDDWVCHSVLGECLIDSLPLLFLTPYALVLALFTVYAHRVLEKKRAGQPQNRKQ